MWILNHSPCKPGVAGWSAGFFSLSDETLSCGPLPIRDVKHKQTDLFAELDMTCGFDIYRICKQRRFRLSEDLHSLKRLSLQL